MANMAGKKKNGGHLEWTHDMRVTLHILYTEYQLKTSKHSVVFSKVFEDHLQRSGKRGDISKCLSAQWGEKEKPGRTDWHSICAATLSPAEVKNREVLRIRIQRAAQEVHQPLHPKAYTGSIRKRSKSRAILSLGQQPDREESSNVAAAALSSHVSCSRGPATKRPAAALQSDHSDGPEPCAPAVKRRRMGVWVASGTPTPDDAGSNNFEEFAPAPRAHRTLDSYAYQAPAPAASGSSHRTAMVFIPRPKTARPPVTPPAKSPVKTPQKKQRRNTDIQKESLSRFDGVLIQVTPKQAAIAKQGPIPVSKEEAHPPYSGLFFRFWTETGSNPHNSEEGFVARKYQEYLNLAQEPPASDTLDWTDIFQHIDRSGIKMGFLSPFISISNSLVWIVRLALKDSGPEGRISIIDADRLDPRCLFYVPPFHRELKKTCQFTDGSWRYAGTHEWMVWKSIPKRAMVHTFKVRDLLQLVEHSQPLQRLLRLQTISRPHDLKTRIIPELRVDQIKLTSDIVRPMAKLAHLMGLRAGTVTIEQLSCFVCEVCQGWALHLPYQEQESWTRLATIFADALFAYCGQHPSPRGLTRIKRGFLDGVAWGSSAHFNARHSPETIRKMYRQAKRIGLEDPGKVLDDELVAARMELVSFELKQQRLLPGRKTQLLLDASPGSDEGFVSGESDDEVPVTPPPTKHNGAARRMMLEDDGDGDESDPDDDTFEYGENGLIV